MIALAAAALAGPVTTIAFCWKLTRSDGLVLGFTGHDRDLLIGGVRYAARPGMTPSAVCHSVELSTDSMEIHGPLSSSGLTASDLESGRWAGAQVELFACDWRETGSGRLGVMQGTMGSVARSGTGFAATFRAELLTELAALEEVQPLRLSPTCRAELGDGRCGVDLRLHRIEIEASGWAGCRVQLQGPLTSPEHFAFGRMRWLSGPLTGLDRRVTNASNGELLLEEPLPDLGSAPGTVRLWGGCDKQIATCASRFANAAAFDGEPHVPGTDALVRYGDR